MTDQRRPTDAEDVTNTDQHQTEEKPAHDEGRRRFTKAGVVGGAVVTTLLSRPALGKQCTHSILASWNLSAHPDLIYCKHACSPGYWKTDNDGVNHCVCEWDNHIHHDYGRDRYFKDVFFPTGNPYGDHDPYPGKTLEHVVNQNGGPLRQAGFHAVAALLNAAHPEVAMAYAWTIDQVISDYQYAYQHYKTNGDDESYLNTFKDKYDIYNDPDWACPLPTTTCSHGGYGG